ncbi:retrovirus-related pol polyprotein from transposon TNT 1-94 [Tanacetum coccineum]
MTIIRLVLSIVAFEDLHLEQLDVKTAFLHGDLDEDIYLIQLEGFQSVGKEENLLCKLKKSLYGLKHRDNEFEMKDLRSAKQILGMSIIRDKMKGALRLSQEKYIGKTEDSRQRMAKVPYASAFSVMYVMVCTRPVIAHAVGVVSIFMSNPGREHWEVVKWLLRYLKGTSNATLCFSRKAIVLEGFSDLDYGECYSSREESSVSWSNEAHQDKISLHPVSEETLYLKKIIRAKNPADMHTKVVTTKKLKLYAASTGLRDN